MKQILLPIYILNNLESVQILHDFHLEFKKGIAKWRHDVCDQTVFIFDPVYFEDYMNLHVQTATYLHQKPFTIIS